MIDSVEPARNTGRGFNLKGFLSTNTDAWASFGFTVLMALFAIAMVPEQSVVSSSEANWNLLGFTETEQVDFESTIKVVDLDLPFEQFEDGGNLVLENTAEGSLPPGWRNYSIVRNDTLGEILRKISTDEEARRYLVSQKMSSYRKLRGGKYIQYKIGDDDRLEALSYKASPELHLSFARDSSGGMKVSEGVPKLTATTVVSTAEITPEKNSLFAASDDANVPDAIIQHVINALETRIDFVRDTRVSDRFTLVYEVLHDEDGDFAGSGELLGLSYVNEKKPQITGLYNPGDGTFYTPEGKSLKRAFLLSPLKFLRISSKFTLSRFNPVLKIWRAHRGVDFAAPTNTPVRSAADGTIEFSGKQGGYGNVIMVKHFGKYMTVYAHLNKFAKGMKRGTKVEQGQIIGYVGSTGYATGPHLHYEFRINNKHVDPLSADIPTTRPSLEGDVLATFNNSTRDISKLLEQAASI